MELILNWKKGFFKTAYELTGIDGLPAGNLSENYWKNTANGELDGRRIHFFMKGFWHRTAEIVDPLTGALIATISFNSWKSRAVIKFTIDPGNEFAWNFENFWQTRWTISSGSEIQIRYNGSQMKGRIVSKLNDPVLILAGLFIASKNWQTTAAAAV